MPQTSHTDTQINHEHLATDSSSDFLGLIRDQVRAEIRAQQASAPQTDLAH